MCGISGFIAKKNSREFELNKFIVNETVENQYNRGPDNQAIVDVETRHLSARFGHNRLSVIDLSTDADQPMLCSSNRYIVVYNGEIYNYLELRQELISLGHTFRTGSDTEVLLSAFSEWGIQAIQRFNGMFAFAIFDKEREVLWLVRDRFGVKPLYYHICKDQLYFASSSYVLAKHLGLEPNMDYLAQGVCYWVYEDDAGTTAYNNLNMLPSGHYLQVDYGGGCQADPILHQYYALLQRATALRTEVGQVSSETWTEMLDEKLQQAVKLRLRADVPVAVSLSGGLDSSTVAALAAQRSPDVMGFTFGDPHNAKTEGPQVRQVADKLNIHVQYISPKPKDFVDAFWKTLVAQDAPFSSGSMVAQYLVAQAVNEQGIKVLLGGQGGDEAFLGYRKFLMLHLQSLLRDKQYVAAAKFFGGLLPAFFSELPSLKTYWSSRKRYMKSANIECKFNIDSHRKLNLGLPEDGSLTGRQMADIMKFSLPTLLRYEDRSSMANSVETRLPFLDYELLELAVALPTHLKLHKGYGKWILREVVKNKIPDSIRLARSKRGFDAGDAYWIDNGLGQSLRDALHENKNRLSEWLSKDVSIDKEYSNITLKTSSLAFREAVSLAWLSKRVG